jgi:hypothetical protein
MKNDMKNKTYLSRWPKNVDVLGPFLLAGGPGERKRNTEAQTTVWALVVLRSLAVKSN